jgi:hypothetical protein
MMGGCLENKDRSEKSWENMGVALSLKRYYRFFERGASRIETMWTIVAAGVQP